MTKDYCSINFAGLTHDHSLRSAEEQDQDEHDDGLCSAISILKRHPMYDCLVLVKKYRQCLGGPSLEFPIDRVREIERVPTNESAHHRQQEDRVSPQQQATPTQAVASGGLADLASAQKGKCGRRRLVTRFLDGDDPMHQAAFQALRNNSSMSLASDQSSLASHSGHYHLTAIGHEETIAAGGENPADTQQAQQQVLTQPDDHFQPFMNQLDDRGEHCSLVHVPINGLLDRLDCYTRSGVAVDGRVYAFAMGLKTAERMMTTKSMRELNETPI